MARVSQHLRLLGLGGIIVVDIQEGPPLSQTANSIQLPIYVLEASRLPHGMLQLRKNFTFDGVRQLQVDWQINKIKLANKNVENCCMLHQDSRRVAPGPAGRSWTLGGGALVMVRIRPKRTYRCFRNVHTLK